MYLKYRGRNGTVYEVDENKIAGGGEGSIHAVRGNDEWAAKIFKPDRRSRLREEKLCYMLTKRLTEVQLKQIAWPLDVIYDKDGFAGYIMPRLKSNHSITDLYDSAQYDLRYRLLAAVNLCVAVGTVHEMGVVCGDLNPQNICVDLNKEHRQTAFQVTLVDTDSYHLSANGKWFRCEVGLADYLAPEIQKKLVNSVTLKNAPLPTYTQYTDLFALAIHIFSLLMNGCHPFACARSADSVSEAPQPVENMADGFFPFYHKRAGITGPVYAPSFHALPDALQQSFIRTFAEGYEHPQNRVSALEWKKTLLSLFGNLTSCGKKHYYFSTADRCPFCIVEQNMRGLLGDTAESERRTKQSAGRQAGISVVRPVHTESQNSAAGTSTKNKNLLRSMKRGRVWSILAAILISIPMIAAMVKEKRCLYEQERYEEWISCAHAALEEDKYEDAVAACDAAIALETEGSQPYLLKGQALYEKGEPQEALLIFGEGRQNAENEEEYTECEEWLDKIQTEQRIEELIDEAEAAWKDKDYDTVLESCDQAMALDTNQTQACLLKGKALYEKGELEKALETYQAGKDMDSGLFYDLYYDLKTEIKEKKERLAIGRKIKRYMAQQKYSSAVRLMRKNNPCFWEKHLIYIKNGKPADTIKNGTGFLFDYDYNYAYIGQFKDGKPHGKGLEAGYPAKTAAEGYYTVNGQFQKGYPHGTCTVYYSHKNTNVSAAYYGNYTRGWEDGSFTMVEKASDDSHSDTYYFTSVMGERSVIETYEGNYVYAKADSGWFYYTKDKSALAGHHTERYGRK